MTAGVHIAAAQFLHFQVQLLHSRSFVLLGVFSISLLANIAWRRVQVLFGDGLKRQALGESFASAVNGQNVSQTFAEHFTVNICSWRVANI